jgi:MerR family copper efflux transcriptional regulator
MQGLSIGQLAKLANVSIDTIRFYEKAGLLAPHGRRPSGFREYSEVDLKQLRFIRRGRSLGFSLEEIGQLLALDRVEGIGSAVLADKLRIVDRKIEELQRWRSGLMEFMRAGGEHGSGPNAILEHFADDPEDRQRDASAQPLQKQLRDFNDEH